MISTKGRYALRVMVDLATQNTEGFIPLKTIAARQEISEKYLELILKSLVQHQLLQGHRGKGGGYRLTRSPHQYTVLEILELTEGSLSPVACLESNDYPCDRKQICSTLPMWQAYYKMVQDFFSGISLSDLVMQSQSGDDYVI